MANISMRCDFNFFRAKWMKFMTTKLENFQVDFLHHFRRRMTSSEGDGEEEPLIRSFVIHFSPFFSFRTKKVFRLNKIIFLTLCRKNPFPSFSWKIFSNPTCASEHVYQSKGRGKFWKPKNIKYFFGKRVNGDFSRDK